MTSKTKEIFSILLNFASDVAMTYFIYSSAIMLASSIIKLTYRDHLNNKLLHLAFPFPIIVVLQQIKLIQSRAFMFTKTLLIKKNFGKYQLFLHKLSICNLKEYTI